VLRSRAIVSQPDATSFAFPAISARLTAERAASGSAAQLAYRVLLALTAAGVLGRLVVILISMGSNDMQTWAEFAWFIREHGLWQAYREIPYFNHPPLMGLLSEGLLQLQHLSRVQFRVLWKLPPLLADLCALRLLWGHYQPRGKLWAAAAVALFSCNPISIAVTAFHGNTDSLCAVLMLYAALLHGRGKPLLAGLALAGAVNVKLIPLILVPGFLLLCSQPRAGLRFLLGFTLGCVPLLIALWVVPREFYANALGYNSNLERWGLPAWGLEAEGEYPRLFQLLTVQYRQIGRDVILVVATALAFLGRFARWDMVRVGALVLAAFLFLAPGFGVQYLVWLVPLLAAASLRYSVWWALLGGAFAVFDYQTFLTGEWPLRSDHQPLNHTVGLVGLCAWAVLGFFLCEELISVPRAYWPNRRSRAR
jgi:hypothetical protein